MSAAQAAAAAPSDGRRAALEMREILRRADPARYVASLFAPAEARPAIWALCGFAHEIARIAGAVSEPMLGEIRLQWWRETLDGVFAGAPRRHGPALALRYAVEQGGLARAPFDRLIDAHAFDLYETPMPNLAALEDYCQAVYGGVMQATAEVLAGRDRGERAAVAAAARAAGIAYGLARVLGSLPQHARQNQTFLPSEPSRAETGLSPEFAGALEAAAQRGRERHGEARAAVKALPDRLLPAFLPAALAPIYFDAAARRGVRLVEEGVAPPPLRIRTRLFISMLCGSI